MWFLFGKPIYGKVCEISLLHMGEMLALKNPAAQYSFYGTDKVVDL